MCYFLFVISYVLFLMCYFLFVISYFLFLTSLSLLVLYFLSFSFIFIGRSPLSNVHFPHRH
ncbi:hypothetical protein BDF14DRAFT_1844620 [Spinellus fusiger]|nr:hypothetical protein BDF14DRAFT_1844620 [Spinellus fusiger]